METPVILSAVRTPVGKFQGALSPFSAPELGGKVIAEASSSAEEILVVECDPHKAEEVRRNWPFLRDRRVDAYSPILQRWLD
jgi:predicted amidohydrolase